MVIHLCGPAAAAEIPSSEQVALYITFMDLEKALQILIVCLGRLSGGF